MDIISNDGNASVSHWDQAHADALDRLRGARAFALITLPRGSEEPSSMALSLDLATEGLILLLCAGSLSLANMAHELQESGA